MIIIESEFFTRKIKKLINDELYAALQQVLILNPELGDIIHGSCGLRKVRWNLRHKGKRGGIRIIYYCHNKKQQIYMLYAYKKNKQENLTKEQLNIVRRLVIEEFNDG